MPLTDTVIRTHASRHKLIPSWAPMPALLGPEDGELQGLGFLLTCLSLVFQHGLPIKSIVSGLREEIVASCLPT